MNLKEWLVHTGVEIDTKKYPTEYNQVENAINKEVWICDYRCGDNAFNKPIRNIKPKLVRTLNANDAKKCICYSPIYFKEIKNGKLLSAEIAPYDNTGYRAHTGVSVNIFDTEEECVKYYIKQVKTAIKNVKYAFNKTKSAVDSKINELESELQKYSERRG